MVKIEAKNQAIYEAQQIEETAAKNDIRGLNLTEMARRVRERRENLKMSREELAERIDVSPQFVAEIEYGKKGVSTKTLYLLSQALNTSGDYLLDGMVCEVDKNNSELEICTEIMVLLKRCNEKQLKGLRKITEVYMDSIE